MKFRLAHRDDASALADLGRRAFVAKFGSLYRPEDLATFLADSHTPAKVAAELADPKMRTAVVEQDGVLLGYCKLAVPSTLPRVNQAEQPVEVKQLYTDPDRLGQGVGARLMDWALAEARKTGADALELSVWSENPGAQRFYARYGMEKVGMVDFMVGTQRDEDWIFSVRL